MFLKCNLHCNTSFVYIKNYLKTVVINIEVFFLCLMFFCFGFVLISIMHDMLFFKRFFYIQAVFSKNL